MVFEAGKAYPVIAVVDVFLTKRVFVVVTIFPSVKNSKEPVVFIFTFEDKLISAEVELEFTFKDKSLQEDVNISTIKILRNDSILYELENTSESNHVSKWHFPNVPKGFKITYPINAQTILPFDQSNELDFWFNGYWKNTGGTSQWLFKPF